MFIYTDPEQEIEVEWFACAPPEVVAQLTGRAELLEEPSNDRKLKFLGYAYSSKEELAASEPVLGLPKGARRRI
jgi:hypothetical protein